MARIITQILADQGGPPVQTYVECTNELTGQHFPGIASQAGMLELDVSPGTYSVRAQAPGFTDGAALPVPNPVGVTAAVSQAVIRMRRVG